jgi:hypothetical protein
VLNVIKRNTKRNRSGSQGMTGSIGFGKAESAILLVMIVINSELFNKRGVERKRRRML